ncbi:MAG: OmpA family protein [Bacteroidota bacterium]|nr:OmpA family protein [Bacteroidota bacterium]MDP4217540.1 OmpA family protein [Bacteroidota bacterium]MDP4246084.1 OmpA family protein [Bacteroidota bacterium]MDP4259431.1 OmpA family protein [Bacteroidota bacterium]
MKTVFILLLTITGAGAAHSQTTGDVLRQSAGQGVHDGAQMATQQTANNVSNRILDKIFSKKKKAAADSAKGKAATNPGGMATGTAAAGGAASASLKTYSKYDFIPGDKILHVEDFAGDAVGDFPVKWNTNGSGEVQTIEGLPGKWLSPGKNSLFYPEYITDLPENFTLQFDLVSSDNYSYYSSAFTVSCVALKNPSKEFTKLLSDVPKTAVDIWFHPQDASPSLGRSGYNVFDNNDRTIHNDASNEQFISKDPNKRSVKVSIWRQKQRLRVYMNEEKVWDLPRAFDATKTYTTLLFSLQDARPNDKYLLSNIRLAVGSPDTRNRLMTEGKFSTTGILFDVNSATIRPESYGALKDIASVLTENAGVRVKIVGHTDNDGDAAMNLALSKKRALAVKEALSRDFNIDQARMDTDGKGSTQPAAPNTSAEGKAQNRRVEFIKS